MLSSSFHQHQVQSAVTEEGARIGMAVKVVETGGKSIKQHLVRMDLTGCFYPDCLMCESGEAGASHIRSCVHYSGVCTLCADQGLVAKYDGESGMSGYHRTKLTSAIAEHQMHLLSIWNCSIQLK